MVIVHALLNLKQLTEFGVTPGTCPFVVRCQNRCKAGSSHDRSRREPMTKQSEKNVVLYSVWDFFFYFLLFLLTLFVCHCVTVSLNLNRNVHVNCCYLTNCCSSKVHFFNPFISTMLFKNKFFFLHFAIHKFIQHYGHANGQLLLKFLQKNTLKSCCCYSCWCFS